ncbi:MAG: hypothetical protein Fur0044_21330 [Anaerolineae bacterium]
MLILEGERPLADSDAFGFVFGGVKTIFDESLHQGGFSHSTLPNKQEFSFIKTFALTGQVLEVVVYNNGGIAYPS